MEPILLGLNITQIILIFFLSYIFLRLVNQIEVEKLNKRIDKYSFKKAKSSDELSLGDYIYRLFRGVIQGVTLIVSKFVKKDKKKYKKFARYAPLENFNPVDVISIKITSSILFTLFIILLFNMTNRLYTDLPFLITLIVGYYLPNIYFLINYRRSRKEVEKNLLNTVILFNNAYKSGKSTLQAIDLIIEQTEETTQNEFKLLRKDLNMGLSIDTAFKRFAERTEIKELDYIATTISISEKTGGNLIKVFKSIEKTLFNREKINHELKTLTANSKITIKILIIMPIIFVVLIKMMSPTFFNPLFNTELGNYIGLLIVSMFILYIFLVSKILKVRV